MSANVSNRKSIRHECKFVVPIQYIERVHALLDHLCAPDPAFQTNIIRSLYYDTDRLELLRQKQASEFLKRKVRVRWYVDPVSRHPGPTAFLEVKSKRGARGYKQRRALSIPATAFNQDPLAAAKLLAEEMAEDLELAATLQELAPACVIEYRRRRFIDMTEGHRIAFDSEIRCSSLNRALFRSLRECRPTVAILEVKGPEARALPRSLVMLHRWGVRKAAFSKYAACLDSQYPLETSPL